MSKPEKLKRHCTPRTPVYNGERPTLVACRLYLLPDAVRALDALREAAGGKTTRGQIVTAALEALRLTENG